MFHMPSHKVWWHTDISRNILVQYINSLHRGINSEQMADSAEPDLSPI